jgi:hypothetical protein
MWYESKMIRETLDSLQHAMQYSECPVDLFFCLNSQTYLESPIDGNPEDMFNEFIDHPILNDAKLIYKRNSDPFYNIGDWRRECYDKSAKYTVWGESDCLIPEDFFYILNITSFDHPHLLTFSSRRMWDISWEPVEHEYLNQFDRGERGQYTAPRPYNAHDVIDQRSLNDFNNRGDIKIIKLKEPKIDGALLSISGGIPFKFIPDDMNFVREDTCAQLVFEYNKIPQYHISTRLKGHNYSHPLKRTNTNSTRDDNVFKEYATKSEIAMNQFIYEMIKV